MSPDPIPTYVYKIVPTAPPEPLPAEYPLSELDQTDGFVHLSTPVQVGGSDTLLILIYLLNGVFTMLSRSPKPAASSSTMSLSCGS